MLFFVKSLGLLFLISSSLAAEECKAGREVSENVHKRIGSWVNICPTVTFACAGNLAKWSYYSKVDDGSKVYLAVWRDAGPNKFKLIGYNDVRGLQVGRLQHEVPREQQIAVRPGDFIGIFYDRANAGGVIPFANDKDLTTFPLSELQDCVSFSAEKADLLLQMEQQDYVTWEMIRVKRLYDLAATVAVNEYDCEAGPAVLPSNLAIPPDTLALVCSDMVLTCPGKIVRWEFVSNSEDNSVFFLSVWRKISGNRHKLIGANKILATKKGPVSVPIPPFKQIMASAGDILGFHYEKPEQAPVVTAQDARGGTTSYDCYSIPLYQNQIDQQMQTNSEVMFSNIKAQKQLGLKAFVKSDGTADCGPPPDSPGATVTGTGTTSGASRTYSCGEGQFLNGNTSIICQDDGTWSDPPQCQNNPQESCGDPPYVVNSVNDFKGTADIGTKVVYQCIPGFSMRGRRELECGTEGTWSLPPTCSKIQRDCQAGTSAIDNPSNDPDRRLLAFPTLRFDCAAEIHQWEFYSRLDDGTTVYFDVWRKVTDEKYELIGSNVAQPRIVGANSLDVEPAKRIKVEKGDFIGLHYHYNNGDGVVPMFEQVYENTNSPFSFIEKIISHPELTSENTRNFYTSFGTNLRDNKKSIIPGLVAFATLVNGCDKRPPRPQYGYTRVQDAVAFYDCATDYKIDGPSGTRCEDSQWPDPPNCVPQDQCSSGLQPLPPQQPPFGSSFFNLFTGFRFKCSGLVKEWGFYSRTRLPINVYISVWEHLDGQRYRMAGWNEVHVDKAGRQTYTVPEGDEIAVYPGYMVGFSYNSLTNFADQQVFMFWDQHYTTPFSEQNMYDGYTLPMTHQDLLDQPNRILEFKLKPNKNWRLPSLYGVVAPGIKIASCGSPPPIQNGTVRPAYGSCNKEDIRVGARWQYQCERGLIIEGWNYAECNSNAQWSNPPKCRVNCNAGPLVNPHSGWPVKSSFLNIFTNLKFRCPGKLIAWRFYALQVAQPVYFGVWERKKDKFVLVQATKVTANKIGENIYNMTAEEQIPVKNGYIVGVHYAAVTSTTFKDNVVVPFAKYLQPAEINDTRMLYDTFYAQIGQEDLRGLDPEVQIRTGGYDRRLPAVNAVVLPTDTYDCVVGTTARLLDSQAQAPRAELMLFFSMAITCEMWIEKWEYWSMTDSGRVVYFGVWREVGPNQFVMVGSNQVKLDRKGTQEYRVPYQFQFQVKSSDFVGIHYDRVSDEGAIPIVVNATNRQRIFLHRFFTKSVNNEQTNTEIQAYFHLTIPDEATVYRGTPALIAYGRRNRDAESTLQSEFTAYWETPEK